MTPVFFNIGINEKATLSEALGYTREQHRSNWDNFDRLKQYHIRYKKLNLRTGEAVKTEATITPQAVSELLVGMEDSLRTNASKNIKILHLAEDICRGLQGIRLTSCKSAKDRTAMAVTLEQCRILQKEFHLPDTNVQVVLDTMRRYVRTFFLKKIYKILFSLTFFFFFVYFTVKERDVITHLKILDYENLHLIIRRCYRYRRSIGRPPGLMAKHRPE